MRTEIELPDVEEIERRLADLPSLEVEVGVAHSGLRTLWPVVAVAIEIAVVAGITVAPATRPD